jgi:hypothetical protein
LGTLCLEVASTNHRKRATTLGEHTKITQKKHMYNIETVTK